LGSFTKKKKLKVQVSIFFFQI